MNLQAEKLNILQTIMSTDDESLIMDVKAFLGNRKTDWFDELSKSQQQDILEGLSQADNGETVSHAEAVQLFGKWGLNNLDEKSYYFLWSTNSLFRRALDRERDI